MLVIELVFVLVDVLDLVLIQEQTPELCYVFVKALVCTSLLVSNIFSLQNLLDLKELRDPGGGSGLMK